MQARMRTSLTNAVKFAPAPQTFDKDKNETRHPISSLDDIYEFSNALKETVAYYQES